VQFSTQKNAGASKPVNVQFSLEDHLIRKNNVLALEKFYMIKNRSTFLKKMWEVLLKKWTRIVKKYQKTPQVDDIGGRFV